MGKQDQHDLQIEITEDAATGFSIRVRHNGRLPNQLADIDRDILRKSHPLIWSRYERRILRKARFMTRPNFKLVRDRLLVERARLYELKLQQKHPRPNRKGLFSRLPKLRIKWLENRARMKQARVESQNRLAGVMLSDKKVMTLTERLRRDSGTALAQPRPVQPERSRGR